MPNTLEEALEENISTTVTVNGIKVRLVTFNIDDIRELILSEAHRIGMEAIGDDYDIEYDISDSSSRTIEYEERIEFANKAKEGQRQRLLELTRGKE